MLSILKMFSTICPYVTDKMYQNLKHIFKTKESSIHETTWPKHNPTLIDDKLEQDMENIGSVTQGILYAREKAQLGVRWPVKSVTVVTRNKDVVKSIKSMSNLIKNQTNIKEITNTEAMKGINTKIKPNYTSLGKSFGEKTQEVAQLIMKADSNKVLKDIEDKGKHIIDNHIILNNHIETEREVPEPWQDAEFKDGIIFLDKTRTPELEAEGFSREIIRRVQALRKKESMQRSDKIELFLKTPADMVDSLAVFTKTMKTITGSDGIMIDSNNPEKQYKASSEEKIKGKEIEIFFSKL